MLSGLTPISNYSSRVYEVAAYGSNGVEQVKKVRKPNEVSQKKKNEAKARGNSEGNGKVFSEILKSKIDRVV